MNTNPVALRPAATILMLREGTAGMEVFMVVRHQQIDFASGALVFPGGRLASGDSDPGVRERCTGVNRLSTDEIAMRVGAIREAFEECGLLLAHSRASSHSLPAAQVTALGERYRMRLERGEI
ncbi:MAG: NUDIX hydrolase, partial [Steroidobacteraceae bacterium]